MTQNERFDYLIVGGGMVADTAARGIRERDADGTIGILSADIDAPYARPALSKKLWTDPEFGWDDVPLGTAEDTGATIRLETQVTAIDVAAHEVAAVSNGTGRSTDTIGYGKLLIATGGTPNELPLPQDDRIIYFRTASDYRRLRSLAAPGAHVAAVGGGYISTELAAALIQNGCRVTLITPDSVLGGSILPSALAQRFESTFRDAGVEVRTGVRVVGGSVAKGSGTVGAARLTLDDGTELVVDAVVAGLGIEPVVDLAADAGLDIADGIVVDEFLRTSADDVFAAGDVAEYPDVILGRRRVEHVDNANQMGAAVGRIMAGDVAPYEHTPYYYSKVLGLSYEAVGQMDAELDIVEDWVEPLEKGIVYYLDDGRPVGVLLWNIEGRRDAARAVLAAADALTRDDLVGRIAS